MIKDIHFEDKTPEAEDFLDSKGYATKTSPEGYRFDNRDPAEGTSTYVPDNIATVTVDPADSTDVTIEIRDVVHLTAPVEGGDPS